MSPTGDRRARRAVGAMVALVAALSAPGPAMAFEHRLSAPDGGAGEQFGFAIAVDGDTAVVGAPAAAGHGAVYVFTRSASGWTSAGRLTAADAAAGDQLGTSVAIDGDTIVAGAPGADYADEGIEGPELRTEQGAVYTFARTGPPVRTETAKLVASDGATGDLLGAAVAVDGATVVAGAVFDDLEGATAPGAEPGTDQGSVYTFDATGAAVRTETAKLTASSAAGDDNLGHSVAVAGDVIVAGAPFADVGAVPDRGAVHAFAASGSAARTETATLAATDGAAGDGLGYSVALEGDTVVTGAPFADVGGEPEEGAAYTFSRTGPAARAETAKLTVASGAPEDSLGRAVAIDASRILVGAPSRDVGANADQGAVHTFARTGGTRTETATLTGAAGAAGDLLGFTVAVEGDSIAAGIPLRDVGAHTDQGSVSIFDSSAGPPPVASPTPTPKPKPKPKPPAGRSRPTVSAFAFKPAVISAARRGRFTYRLDVAARVTVAIDRRLAGRRRGRRCVAPAPGLVRRCVRHRRAGSLRIDGRAGRNAEPFSGRLRRRALGPGRYRATITARTAGGTSEPRTTTFRVIRSRRR